MTETIENTENYMEEITAPTVQKLPLLAMRGIVLFPNMIMHFDLAREPFVKALRAGAKSDRRVFLVTQKDPLVEYKSEAYDLFITLMESIKSEAISNLFKSTTNLDAFEDFLASLPQFESSDENQEGGTSLPEIGFDGMPSDLLSALREQVSRAREQQSARQAEPEQAPAVISDATTIGEGYKPAVAEPKLVMPKRKVSVVLRKEEAPQAPAETPVPGEGEEIAVTLDSQDFAETMDNRDSADTRTF